MVPVAHAVVSGGRRGLLELKHMYTTGPDLFGQLFWPVVMVMVLFFMRDTDFAGLPLPAIVLPGIIGMTSVFTGLLGVSGVLCVEREDGTLLRAKAMPHGLLGYLVGKVVLTIGLTVLSILLLLVCGAFLAPDLVLGTPGAWLGLAGMVLLGAVATMPLGAVAGSLLPHPRSQAVLMPWIAGIIAASGIFYPITALPAWLQNIGQVFPVYWLGLGVRSALLPDDAAVIEIAGSWRHLETVGVLGAWAVAGLVLAAVVLPRMARKESGSVAAARRERALKRIG
jgi:ABC-2 type transport system permease protein